MSFTAIPLNLPLGDSGQHRLPPALRRQAVDVRMTHHRPLAGIFWDFPLALHKRRGRSCR